MKKMKQQPTLQVISPAKTNGKKTNGHADVTGGTLLDRPGFGLNTRTFETRFEPRYKEMPPVPEGLEEPIFSESANKILKERYLLKGGNLQAIETIQERFWHIAYDISL
jgi:hypothetical protein